jgi:cytochrome c oxidase subunit 3
MAEVAPSAPLPVGAFQRQSLGWSGVKMVIATEAALFAFLLFCYYYYDVQLGGSWRPYEPARLRLALPNTIILLISSGFVAAAEHRIKRDAKASALVTLAIGILLGIVFVIIQGLEWANKPFTIKTSLYGSLYYTITGFHMAHVVVGIGALILAGIWTAFGYFSARRHAGLIITSIYWHFVDAVWLTVFFTYYISPRLW